MIDWEGTLLEGIISFLSLIIPLFWFLAIIFSMAHMNLSEEVLNNKYKYTNERYLQAKKNIRFERILFYSLFLIFITLVITLITLTNLDIL